MDIEFDKLLLLQDVDLAIYKVRVDLAKIPVQVEELNDKSIENQDLILVKKKEIYQLQSTMHSTEIKIEELEVKIKKFNQGLSTTKSNSTYKSMLAQIDMARKTKDGLEEDVIEFMLQLDAMNSSFALLKKDIDIKNKTIEENTHAKNQYKDKIIQALKALESKRNTVKKGISEAQLLIYERLLQVNEQHVISIVKDDAFCSQCGQMLTSLIMSQLLFIKDKFIFCSLCRNILYLEEKKDKDEEIEDTC